ncbi:unnamed protein product [marine sediment metagenome]|uniref:Uncharacterized protein n=1 Tax=marine sediment metagenome TaxID=412755 RepID=X1MSI1_9ZZZZ
MKLNFQPKMRLQGKINEKKLIKNKEKYMKKVADHILSEAK